MKKIVKIDYEYFIDDCCDCGGEGEYETTYHMQRCECSDLITHEEIEAYERGVKLRKYCESKM